jgi:dTDP-4-amino-4,6-dideoxygalactose transaminase
LERTISKHSSENLRAIIPVHLYGYPIDMEIIIALAHDKHLFVIEDCAQAHGAMVNGKKVGTFGDIAAFSFYPTKNLGAIGDGGALASCQSGLIEKSRLLSEYGWKERYISEYSGLNSRLDEIQAAILRVKLRWLDQENNRRREIAAQYINGLSQLPDLQLPETYNKDHVFHQFVVRSRDREKLRQWMFERGVGTLIHYPVPVHKQPAYRNRLLCDPKGLKITEHLCDEILSLPMYPQMSNSQVEQVIEVIQSFFQKSL